MRTARVLRTLRSGGLIFLIFLPLELNAQTEQKANSADTIQCLIEANPIWTNENPILVSVRLKNASDKEVNLRGIYTFELTGVPGPYWSPVNIRTGTPLELEFASDGNGGGRVPRDEIHLEPGETREMKLEVSSLSWNKSVSSVWPHKKLFEVVPNGTYDLRFALEAEGQANSDNTPEVIRVVSNSIRIAVD
jgi:hypothetical protein